MAGHPAGRVLHLLELVQERPGITGPLLAVELGVAERTVRRYVTTLQDLGIPLETSRGRFGGYRIGAGYRMPPLMLTSDEAVAVTLALAVMSGSQPRPADPAGDTPPPPTPGEAALAKLQRVLPRDVTHRVAEVLEAVSPPRGRGFVAGPAPDPALLTALAAGVVGRRRCRLRHRSQHDEVTVREVNPYGVAAVQSSWYLHAWCHLRKGRRTFRIDRIDRVDVLSETFSAPQNLDIVAAVERSLALARPEWPVTLHVHAPYDDVAPLFPRFLGVCEPLDADTTLLRSSTSNLDYFVLRISDHPFTMTVIEPAELRTAFERRGQRMLETARGYPAQHE